ncbi:MAG: hypothetical protein QG620_171 [Patescibacteria group bacterium]|nr:hypothetical protein [Patescibacteria group bacterium]
MINKISMKKAFSICFLIVSIGLFLSADITLAAECATAGGTCYPTSCPADKPQQVTDGECTTPGQVCCKAGTATTTPTGVYIPNGSEVGLPDPSGGIAAVIKNVLSWMLGIIGMIAIIAFVISGLQYLTSRGDEKQIETAKTNMTYSIIGVVVALSGFIIIQAIDLALRATSSSF